MGLQSQRVVSPTAAGETPMGVEVLGQGCVAYVGKHRNLSLSLEDRGQFQATKQLIGPGTSSWWCLGVPHGVVPSLWSFPLVE